MSADAQPCPKQRATKEEDPNPGSPPNFKDKNVVGALCVVCGDRACSHLYYGVAACHGCKCFFWRTVKSRLTYVCRYGGSCTISTAGRNACRFCRFNRCLEAGMKTEAVKMDRKLNKRKKKEMDSDEFDEGQDSNQHLESAEQKRRKLDDRLLVSSLLLIDKTASEGNAKVASPHSVELSLTNLLDQPGLLDGFRFDMSYRATQIANETSCFDAERRLYTWAFDWCRQVIDIEETLQPSDTIALLRACCTSLVLLELAKESSVGPPHQLALCNNTFLHTQHQPPANSFINWKTVQLVTKWAHHELKPLGLKPKEDVLLKALIVLNPDAPGLSSDGEAAVRQLRDRIHTTLFQLCMQNAEPTASAARLSSILLLIPQIMLMGAGIVEQVRVRNTFSQIRVDRLLFWQLYGDIFENSDAFNEDVYFSHSASCSPVDSNSTDSS